MSFAPFAGDQSLREITIGSRRIYEGRVVRLRVDEVQLPDGRRGVREVVEHRGAVGAVPVTEDGRVLLVRQWRQAVGREMLEIPAGTREPGEDDRACMQRELAEEIGRHSGRLEPLAEVFLAPGYSTESIMLFLALQLTAASANPDADENLRVVALPFAEAVAMCYDGRLRDAATVAGLLLAAPRLRLPA